MDRISDNTVNCFNRSAAKHVFDYFYGIRT